MHLASREINGIEIKLTACCPVDQWRVREDKACIRYKLAGIDYHNGKIRTGSEVTTASGLVGSLHTLLENQAKFAAEEQQNLEICRRRLAQLQANAGRETFQYADERNALQKELNAILYELNAQNLLPEGRKIKMMPRLEDYLNFGMEVIADKVAEVTEECPEPPEEEDLRKSA